MERIRQSVAKSGISCFDKKVFAYSVLSVLFWWMATHFYGITRMMVSHDSLTEFYAEAGLPIGYTSLTWKIALGRFVIPVYLKLFRGTVSAPWLIGFLAMVFLTIAVYITVCILKLRSPLSVFLTAGVMVANPVVYTTASTYIHELDCYMLALLFATLAVWCWQQKHTSCWGIGAVCVCICMGIYASYLSVTIVLIIMTCILWLIEKEYPPEKVIVYGIAGVGMICLGLILYAAATGVVCRISGVSLIEKSSNSILNAVSPNTYQNVFKRLGNCYSQVWYALTTKMFGHNKSVNLVAIFALASILVSLIWRGIQNRIVVLAAVLSVLLLSILPIGMNLSMLANNGNAHDLMKYAFLIPMLLAIVPLERIKIGSYNFKSMYAVVLAGCIAMFSWNYAVQANQIYVKKELEEKYTYSFMTRLLTRIEQTEGYLREETPVLLVGRIDNMIKERRELTRYRDYTGNIAVTPITFGYQYRMYLEYMLGTAIYVDVDMEHIRNSDQVREMGVYPSPDSIRMVDGVLVVKLESDS